MKLTIKFRSDAEAAIVIEDSNSGTDYNRIGVITNDMTFITNNNETNFNILIIFLFEIVNGFNMFLIIGN